MEEFDIMRGLAILIILFHHLPDYGFNFFDLNNFGIGLDLSFLNGLNTYFGLGLFIYVSGVLLQHNYQGLSGGGQGLSGGVFTFLKKRFFRIFPLYYISLALFIAMMSVTSIRTILVQALGLQLIFATPGHAPMLTLWFIGLITVYYGLFVLIKRAEGKGLRFFLTLAVFPMLLIIMSIAWGAGDPRLFLYYPVFLIGIYGDRCLSGINNYKRAAALAVLMLASIYLSVYQSKIVLSWGGILGIVLVMNCIMVSFTWLVRLISRRAITLSKYFKALSYSSYCIYLFHRPVWWTLLRLENPYDPETRLLYLAFVGVPVIILLAYAIQKGYDRFLKLVFMRSPSVSMERGS